MKKRFLCLLVMCHFVLSIGCVAEASFFDEYNEQRANGTYQQPENNATWKDAEKAIKEENPELYEAVQRKRFDELMEQYAVSGSGEVKTENKISAKTLSKKEFEPESVEWWETKKSTCFCYVGYNEDLEELAVIFRSNDTRTYVYDDFTAEDFDNFLSASSLGKYYNKNIKGVYSCTRYDDVGADMFK